MYIYVTVDNIRRIVDTDTGNYVDRGSISGVAYGGFVSEYPAFVCKSLCLAYIPRRCLYWMGYSFTGSVLVYGVHNIQDLAVEGRTLSIEAWSRFKVVGDTLYHVPIGSDLHPVGKGVCTRFSDFMRSML